MAWTRKDDHWAILFYENKTGNHNWTPEEVAKFLLDGNHVTPPQAPTPLAMLTRRIASAARRRERGIGDALDHRLHVPYRVEINGDVQLRWVSLDGTGMTEDIFNDAMHLRHDLAVNVLVRIAADIEYIRKQHPAWSVRPLDTDLTQEVQWRLPVPSEGEDRKAG